MNNKEKLRSLALKLMQLDEPFYNSNITVYFSEEFLNCIDRNFDIFLNGKEYKFSISQGYSPKKVITLGFENLYEKFFDDEFTELYDELNSVIINRTNLKNKCDENALTEILTILK